MLCWSLSKILRANTDIYDERLLTAIESDWIEEPEWFLEYVLEKNWVLNKTQLEIISLIKKWYNYSTIAKKIWMWYYKMKREAERATQSIKTFLNTINEQC